MLLAFQHKHFYEFLIAYGLLLHAAAINQLQPTTATHINFRQLQQCVTKGSSPFHENKAIFLSRNRLNVAY